jgi:hypothetical protein
MLEEVRGETESIINSRRRDVTTYANPSQFYRSIAIPHLGSMKIIPITNILFLTPKFSSIIRYGLVARICRSHQSSSLTAPTRPGFDSRCRNSLFLRLFGCWESSFGIFMVTKSFWFCLRLQCGKYGDVP